MKYIYYEFFSTPKLNTYRFLNKMIYNFVNIKNEDLFVKINLKNQ